MMGIAIDKLQDDELQRRLIDAVNLLAEYAKECLPAGWEFTLTLSREEAYAELNDPNGFEEQFAAEFGIGCLASACYVAEVSEEETSDEETES